MKQVSQKKINVLVIGILIAFILFILSIWDSHPTKVYAYAMINSGDIIDNDLIITKPLDEIEDMLIANSYSETSEKSLEDEYEPTSLDEIKEIVTYKPPAEKKVKPEQFSIYNHIIKEGESLWSISKKYNTDVNSIVAANNLKSSSKIFPNIKLKVPNMVGLLVKIEKNDSLYKLSRKYDVPLKNILQVNNLTSKTIIHPGDFVFVPGAKQSSAFKYSRVSKRKFIWPAATKRISSYYGYRIHPLYKRKIFHQGLDIAGPIGSKIYASSAGKIYYAGWVRGYGRVIIIKHNDGYSTRYAHLSRIKVRVGEWVEQGELIGYMGKTGRVTGPHLHFEIIRWGKHYNPLRYVKR